MVSISIKLKGFSKYYSSHFIFFDSRVLLVQPGQKDFKAKQSIVYCFLEQGFYWDYKRIILL